MILGYNFVEERLFAFRDYAGLSEEDAKLLRNYRNEVAYFLDLDKKRLRKEGNTNIKSEDLLKVVRDPEYHLKKSRNYEEILEELEKHGETSRYWKNLSRGAKLQAKVLEDRAMEKAEVQWAKILERRAKELGKLPFLKTKRI
jgi:hypothetical protein